MRTTRAWTSLVALSAATTLIAFGRLGGLPVSLVILALAWAKARIILREYLGLSSAPAWGRGFGLVLALYMGLAATLIAMAGTG